MVYVGMDVHRKRTQVAILDESGCELTNRNVISDPVEIAKVLEGLEPGTQVAFEAGYGWSWLAELLEDLSLEAHLAHPRGCKAIASAHLKNDKVDARMLAHLLRTDLLAEAWIAPPEVRDLRALLRYRASLVRSKVSAKNRIHALLADQGLQTSQTLWTVKGREWLQGIQLSPVRRQVMDGLLCLIDALDPLITAAEKEIAARAKPDPRVQALMALPGIGRRTAMMLVAEIGDISRFPTARKLCAWAGLTPSVHNSDRTVRHGHITKEGSVWVRWVLTEAAQIARRYPPFDRTWEEIARRRGGKIATVALARKLLARSFHVLKQVG
jgi:transposase